MEDKIIVTNRAALTAKYGPTGLAKIHRSLAALIAADRRRGLETAVVYLDSAAAMKRLGGKAVPDVDAFRETKEAIDRIFTARRPDYLMILGAPDVVCHQDLRNPVFDGTDDDDRRAWGDVPYACDTPYSRNPARFIGPTRVVGRLPDLVAADEPSYLLGLLKTAASWRRRPVSDYAAYFGLSAEVWKGSTRLSLDTVFGSDDDLLLSPPRGPRHPAAALGRRMHFINCHGAPASPEFYGERRKKYPTALRTATIGGAIAEGTVAAVECCFGGELYDSVTLGLDMPICQSYLKQGAYGYLGSTTIAYGPPDDNGAADLVCQYFLLDVLDGASIGRATLMARQQFVEHTAQMDPIDLKTLAQFCLYGDPSVHPVVPHVAAGVPAPVARAKAARFFRSERRAKLKLNGKFLQETKPTASKRQRKARVSRAARSILSKIARRGGLPAGQGFVAFGVSGAARVQRAAGKALPQPSRYHLAVGKPDRRRIAVVAKEVDGRIIAYRIYHER
jgi:hypothetical protein